MHEDDTATPIPLYVETPPAPNRAQRRAEDKKARKVEAWLRRAGRLQRERQARLDAKATKLEAQTPLTAARETSVADRPDDAGLSGDTGPRGDPSSATAVRGPLDPPRADQ